MRNRAIAVAVAVAALTALQGAAEAAQVDMVAAADNICEVSNGQVDTVRVRLLSPIVLEYYFERLPGGPVQTFPAVASMATIRKFPLAPGSYRLTYKQPAYPTVGAHTQTVVVRSYRLINGNCVMHDVLDQARPVDRKLR